MISSSTNLTRSRTTTLEWLYEHLKDDGEYCERDWQILSPGDALKSAWDQFCHAIKHETRFLMVTSTAKNPKPNAVRLFMR